MVVDVVGSISRIERGCDQASAGVHYILVHLNHPVKLKWSGKADCSFGRAEGATGFIPLAPIATRFAITIDAAPPVVV